MSVSSRCRPSLTSPSTASVQHTASVRSTSARRPPPPITTVVTTPPWARDEPPSPNDRASVTDSTHGQDQRPSDAVSYLTSPEDPPSRWWSFTLPRTARQQPQSDNSSPATARPDKKSIRDISISWLPTSSPARDVVTSTRKGKEKDAELGQPSNREHDWALTLPAPPLAPDTLSHNITPGWDDPWSPRPAAQGPAHNTLYGENFYGLGALDDADGSEKSRWYRRRKRFRAFILSNTYVPLLFRLINITFTTSALAVAIRIRMIEMVAHSMGAVGSSPTVVIIFAPLTLVHVMIAIYLEYFGRPLGLWRTSGKLTYTLSEVLFICAWSAALSLCFDNFFTSLIPCASASSISWYNELPRPPSVLPSYDHSVGDRICDHQLALICLVAIGLLAYCANLVISLFRIFEKVKYSSSVRMRSQT